MCELRNWSNHFNPCCVEGPIVQKYLGRMTILKKILERLSQAIDAIDNPKKAA
jgi:hypothetical protein